MYYSLDTRAIVECFFLGGGGGWIIPVCLIKATVGPVWRAPLSSPGLRGVDGGHSPQTSPWHWSGCERWSVWLLSPSFNTTPSILLGVGHPYRDSGPLCPPADGLRPPAPLLQTTT